jgi:hypothetical protein|eukprot:COSAG06_NODE_1128_length_10601_cov_13.337460_7_plen_59_part_00
MSLPLPSTGETLVDCAAAAAAPPPGRVVPQRRFLTWDHALNPNSNPVRKRVFLRCRLY